MPYIGLEVILEVKQMDLLTCLQNDAPQKQSIISYLYARKMQS